MNYKLRNLISGATITLSSLLIVAIFLGLKYLASYYNLEFVSANALFTSFIASIVFIYGFMLYGTIKEYRDSIDIPYQVRMYLDSILRDGILIKKINPKFNYERLRSIILDFVSSYNQQVLAKNPRMDCLYHLYELDDVFVDISNLGLPESYITTMKNKKFEIKRFIISWFEIKKQKYMPLLSQLQYAMTAIIIFLMLFLKAENRVQDYIVTGGFVFVFAYLLFTLDIMDNPFTAKNKDIAANLENLITFEHLLNDKKL